MTRRLWTIAALVAVTGIAVAAWVAFNQGQSTGPIRIGYAISLSGVNMHGAATSMLPNYRLWLKQVDAAGGIMVGDRRRPVEVIEYDDESRAEKAVELVERLISKDKVDFILPPWGTGLNLAVAPLLHRAGYPHLAVTALSDQTPELVQRWPNSVWFLATMTQEARALVGMLAALRGEGKIGKAVAIASVADQLGIGLAKAGRRELERAGFEIVYDRAYSVGESNMRPLIEEAKAIGADSFLCFSYPPDTVALTEQARQSGFNPKIFYAAIGTAYPSFRQRFGADTEGVIGAGGWNPDSPESRRYTAMHIEATGQEPDGWASPITYAALQMLQQAIERSGTLDRATVIDAIRSQRFETILGPVQLVDNMYRGTWLAGQWQGGEFQGIAPATLPGAQTLLFPKPAWGSSSGEAPFSAYSVAPLGLR